MNKRTLCEDAKLVAWRLHQLESEAKAYAETPNNSHRLEQLVEASVEYTETIRRLRNRKEKQ